MLIAPIISKLQNDLALTLNIQTVMMFKEVVIEIGAISFTMENLVKMQIANDAKEKNGKKKKVMCMLYHSIINQF